MLCSHNMAPHVVATVSHVPRNCAMARCQEPIFHLRVPQLNIQFNQQLHPLASTTSNHQYGINTSTIWFGLQISRGISKRFAKKPFASCPKTLLSRGFETVWNLIGQETRDSALAAAAWVPGLRISYSKTWLKDLVQLFKGSWKTKWQKNRQKCQNYFKHDREVQIEGLDEKAISSCSKHLDTCLPMIWSWGVVILSSAPGQPHYDEDGDWEHMPHARHLMESSASHEHTSRSTHGRIWDTTRTLHALNCSRACGDTIGTFYILLQFCAEASADAASKQTTRCVYEASGMAAAGFCRWTQNHVRRKTSTDTQNSTGNMSSLNCPILKQLLEVLELSDAFAPQEAVLAQLSAKQINSAKMMPLSQQVHLKKVLMRSAWR